MGRLRVRVCCACCWMAQRTCCTSRATAPSPSPGTTCTSITGARPGVNCCDSPAGCATCCFDKPPHPYLPGCGDLTNGSDPYGSYHTVQAYYTADFTTFTNLGMALELAVRKPGTEFRPHVVCNPKTKKFLMWFEDRGSGLTGCKRCTLHFDLPFPHPGHLHLPLPPPLYITPPSLGPTANCHQQTPPRSRLRH